MSDRLKEIEKENFAKINEIMNKEKNVEIKYENRAIRETGKLVKGKKHGVWKSFYPNGNLKLKEPYIYGGLNGTRKEYYENGQIKSELNYKSNKYNGEQKEYYENGDLIVEGNCINDMLDGDIKYYRDGELYLIERYEKDKMIEEIKLKEEIEENIIIDKKIEKSTENDKSIRKLENGNYQVEFWHNEIAFERSIYPNENIDEYRPLERKIYENEKLYLDEIYSYEKNEKQETIYLKNGDKQSTTLTKYGEGISIIDNFYEGTEQVEKREYRDINTWELGKEDFFSKEGVLEREKIYEAEEKIKTVIYENGVKKEEEVNRKIVENDITTFQIMEERTYYENGNLKQEIEYKEFLNTEAQDKYGNIVDEFVKREFPVKERNYDEYGQLINEKIKEYHREYDEFELLTLTERTYEKEGIKEIVYDEKQIKIKEGYLNEDGLRDGIWKKFNKEGKITKEEQYKDGELEGIVRETFTRMNPEKEYVDVRNIITNGELEEKIINVYNDEGLKAKETNVFNKNRVAFREIVGYVEGQENIAERSKYDYHGNLSLKREEKNIFQIDTEEMSEKLIGGYIREYNEKEEKISETKINEDEKVNVIEKPKMEERTVYPKDGVSYYFFIEKEGERYNLYRTENVLDNQELLIRKATIDDKVYLQEVSDLDEGLKIIEQKYTEDRENNYLTVLDSLGAQITDEGKKGAIELLREIYPKDDIEKEIEKYIGENYKKVDKLLVRKEKIQRTKEHGLISNTLKNGITFAVLENTSKRLDIKINSIPDDKTGNKISKVVGKDKENNIVETEILNANGNVESKKTLFYNDKNELVRTFEESNGMNRIRTYEKGVLQEEIVGDKNFRITQKFKDGELVERELRDLKAKNNRLILKYEENILKKEEMFVGKNKGLVNISYSKEYDKSGVVIDEKYREGNLAKDIVENTRKKFNEIINKIKFKVVEVVFGKQAKELLKEFYAEQEREKNAKELSEAKGSHLNIIKDITKKYEKALDLEIEYPNAVENFTNVKNEKVFQEGKVVEEKIEKGDRTETREYIYENDKVIKERYKEYSKDKEVLSEEIIDLKSENKRSEKNYYSNGKIYINSIKEVKEEDKQEGNYQKDIHYNSDGKIHNIVEIKRVLEQEELKSTSYTKDEQISEVTMYKNDNLESRKVYEDGKLERETINQENGVEKTVIYNLKEQPIKIIESKDNLKKIEEISYKDNKKIKSESKLIENGRLKIEETKTYGGNEELEERKRTEYDISGDKTLSIFNKNNSLVEWSNGVERKEISYYTKDGKNTNGAYDKFKENHYINDKLRGITEGQRIEKEGESVVAKRFNIDGELEREERKYNKDYRLISSVEKQYERGVVIKEITREFDEKGKETSKKEEVSNKNVKLIKRAQDRGKDSMLER